MSAALDKASLDSLRGTNDMMIRFRHYRPGEIVEEPHGTHEDHRYARVPFDDVAFAEIMERCNREFGDPTVNLGGPVLPPVEKPARRQSRRDALL
jgi:hypothetical protein